jgi:predicted NAD-dependent protein-ADP-ribosyltransferase YbiA (DUF1768 family)
MSSDKAKIVDLARTFKDEVLVPLANEGVLDAEVLDEVLTMYLSQLDEQTNPNRPIIITETGEWKDFHPCNAGPLKVTGVTWPTVEHYRIASAYFGMDEDLITSIREAKTPIIAHRRAENARLADALRRFDFEETQDLELKTAYTTWLLSQPETLAKLKATGKANISLEGTNDPYLGIVAPGKGNNAVGKILTQLRSEL